MKVIMLLLPALALAAQVVLNGDKTITKVVKLLQNMMDKSKEDSESERELYAKFKCYSDTNTEEKTQLVSELTTQIGLLGSQIEALQGENGGLSAQVAALKADIEANEQARSEAEAIRTKAATDFAAEEADLTGAISQLGQAIEVLSEIGSDQTLQSAADHDKFLAGYGSNTQLIKIQTSVKQALIAANTFLAPAQRKKVESFVQAPFTGTYSSQSGEITGILKQMKDTFSSNLEAAQSTEAAAIKADEAFMATKLEEHTTMTTSYEQKSAKMGENDGELATKKGQLGEAETSKADAETFLANLAEMAADKSKEYESRKLLRANEEAAIAQAISILNSDAAFHAFGKMDATSTGSTGASLVQLRAVHRHLAGNQQAANSTRVAATKVLEHCSHHSKRAHRVMLLLQAGNPFATVLTEIEKMITLIDAEEAQDTKELNWCNAERETNDATLEQKVTDISTIETQITDLTNAIEDPETGIKKQIGDTEESLETNSKNQKEETTARREATSTYTQAITHAVEAQSLLATAVKVLVTYYNKIEKEEMSELGGALLQGKQKKQEPPSTWEGSYSGQSSSGNQVIDMLNFIAGEAKKEEDAAHQAELEDQQSYEDSMGNLKAEETSSQLSLVSLKKSLADKELELQSQSEALDVANREKLTIEQYLAQIKPGCDFITTNYETRSSNRAEEKTSLQSAVTLLSATPAFKAAVSEAELTALGACKSLCLGSNRTHVQCEACLADVTEPGYCAGHPGTEGC